ncbi:MAG: methionine adenosyltransferase [Rickettsiales bacterium]
MASIDATSRRGYVFSSESVSEGHPDKVCDLISDALVDAFLARDPEARTAIEVLATTDRIVIAGEYKSADPLSFPEIKDVARRVVRDIGYEQRGFHWNTAAVEVYVHGQSSDIALGVDAKDDKGEGAGDQGLMFGYACNETAALIPAPHYYAHKILRLLSERRRAGDVRLQPDAKSQVTMRYENGKPVAFDAILVSSQHRENVGQRELRDLIREIVLEALPEGAMCAEERFLTNPTGRFIIGGPDGDTGLTGRKIIVDTYGGAAPHGGGAFSGKDPTKVDRSAAYAARYLAKNVVAAGLADRCLIQIAYAIGVPEPLSFYCNTFGTGTIGDDAIETALRNAMDLTPKAIRTRLQLNRPIYFPTAAYGHFGRAPTPEGHFSWEKIDLAEELTLVLATGR